MTRHTEITVDGAVIKVRQNKPNLNAIEHALGPVLFDHLRIVPFGDQMAAAPISTLW